MQTHPELPPTEYDQQGAPAEETSGKKSMMTKVKDKARKLKTKMKKPKSPGSADAGDESSSGSSSENESGSEPQQQVGDDGKQGRDMEVNPGLQGDAYEAIPDPHATSGTAGTAGVEKQFGQLGLDDKPNASKLQDEVPSAPGGTSAGLPSYLATHDPAQSPHAIGDVPVDEGKNVEGKDVLITPTSTDTDSRTHTAEGVAATAAAGAGAVGLKSLSDDSENVECKDTAAPGGKSMLQQAREKVFGSSTKTEGEDLNQTSESKSPTFTERATGFKDTIAAKLGYGSNKNLPVEEGSDASPMQVDPQNPENKSVLEKVKDNAAGVSEAVTSKLGGEGNEVGDGKNKSFTQKAYDTAYGAKDTVASKLGYGNTDTTGTVPEGEQKSYLQGAKEAVASKLGYDNRELPASTEGAYSDEQNTPASTEARFHPGDEDRALSQLITEKMSTGAATVKDTLMRPFGSPKSGPPTPVTTPPPASATAVAQDPVHNTVPEAGEGVPPEEKPAGIVGKVTGAVTSLLGTSGSGKKREEETVSKANEDSQTPGAGNVETY